ncbi:maltokinase, partial [Mycobacterium manitobense]|nr:maltokinase [[Mycobacterium] manitobense]
GSDGGRTGYDAMVDPQAAGRLLALVAASEQIDAVRFCREPGADLGPGTPVRVMSAEQSNTSVVFGEQSILKVFRRLIPGINPDIELTRALAGNPYITPLLGSYEIDWDSEQYMLGMVSTFARDSTDGWQLATAPAGDDFGAESHRLGQAVASVHRDLDLAERLGT